MNLNFNHLNEKHQLVIAFPEHLKQDVEKVCSILSFCVDRSFSEEMITICQNEEFLQFPYRIYFDEPDNLLENELTTVQKTILNCILSRHYNGFIRQKRIEQLVDRTEYWIIPFTFQLLGEYVYEILEVVNQHVNENTLADYKNFKAENAQYFQQTESRMSNYWNVYYRKIKFPNLKKYLGRQIFVRIKRTTRRH